MLLQNVSPTSTYEYPIDLNITIRSEGDEYEATIQVSGIAPQSFPIEVTHHGVEELSLRLREEIEEVRKNYKQDGVSRKALSHLAYAGKAAFNTIFGNGTSVLYRAIDLIQPKSRITIEVSSKNFFLPWE